MAPGPVEPLSPVSPPPDTPTATPGINSAPGASTPPPPSGEVPIAVAPATPAPVPPPPAAVVAVDLSMPVVVQPREPRFYERWWFWTAIAAVGVTAVVIIATSGPSPPKTDLPNMVAF
jgi:hypothetical protein